MDHALVAGAISHLEQLGHADAFFLTDVIDLSASAGHSAESESLVVDLIPSALAANSFHGVVAVLAGAGAALEDLVDTASDNAIASGIKALTSGAAAGHGDGVVGGGSFALGADSADHEEALGAAALGLEDVVYLVCGAGDSADGQIGIVEGIDGALLADACDQVVAGLADTLAVDVEGVDVLTGSGLVWQSGGGSGSNGGGYADA